MEIMPETDRLILRRWKTEDAEDLYAYAKYEEVGSPCGWVAHVSVNHSRQIITDYFMREKFTFAIVLKSIGRPIGCISLRTYGMSFLVENDRQAELGYWLGKPFWGQGLMPEAVNCLLKSAFNKWGFAQIWSGYYEGNDKSRRVLQKCGFKYQYTIKDKYLPILQEFRTEHVFKLNKDDFKI